MKKKRTIQDKAYRLAQVTRRLVDAAKDYTNCQVNHNHDRLVAAAIDYALLAQEIK